MTIERTTQDEETFRENMKRIYEQRRAASLKAMETLDSGVAALKNALLTAQRMARQRHTGSAIDALRQFASDCRLLQRQAAEACERLAAQGECERQPKGG